MQIAASTLTMSSAHAESSSRSFEERLRVQVPAASSLPAPAAGDTAEISAGAVAAAGASMCPAAVSDLPVTEEELKFEMLRRLLEQVTGKQFNWGKVQEFLARMRHLGSGNGLLASGGSGPSDRAAEGPAGFGLQYDSVQRYSEQESMAFAAAGLVRTADGREIQFSVGLSMSRSFMEEQRLHIEIGDTRTLQDPLVLNFGGTAAQVSSTRFAFDLDADGQAEDVPLPGANTAFLVRDVNGNGAVDDGSELFGPRTGEGFGELAALDADGNGWIDEADASFARLGLWTPDAKGAGTLSTLAARGVGAIGVDAVATPFAVKDAANQTLGQVTASGVYLTEAGTAGTVQQIDLTV